MTETMGPMGVLHGRHGSEIHPSDGETSVTPSSTVGPMAGTSGAHG